LTILKGLDLSITTGLPLPVGRFNLWKRKRPDLAILTLNGSNFMGYRVQLLQSWDASRYMDFLLPPVSLVAIERFNHFVVGDR
jgi:hypothetical protein